MIFLNFFLNFLRVFGRYGLGVEFAFYFGVGAYAEGEAALGVLVARDSHVDDEVFAAALTHLADHVEGELQTTVDVSAVLIRALVV